MSKIVLPVRSLSEKQEEGGMLFHCAIDSKDSRDLDPSVDEALEDLWSVLRQKGALRASGLRPDILNITERPFGEISVTSLPACPGASWVLEARDLNHALALLHPLPKGLASGLRIQALHGEGIWQTRS